MRRVVHHFEEALAGALLVVMAVLAFLNILVRYFTRYSFAFTEELEVTALVWITMLGAAVGFRESVHLGFTILRDRFPRPVRQALAVASSLIAVATMLVLIWAGWRQIQSQIALGTTSEALGLPEWTYTAALPAGALLVIARVLQALRVEIHRA
ncbi:MAG TPA: TRAP transporter small permease [Methylomirabilota bacterium]|nr:TRAP transporter small permease [Methylomirabilota bacterium]